MKKMWHIYVCVCVCVCIYIYIYIYNGILLNSLLKKNEILPLVATWNDLENIILSEVIQAEKDIYYMTSHMWNLKNNANESIYKTEIDSHT